MKMKRWLIPLLAVVALATAPSAAADSYVNGLVGRFGPSAHVVADPAARPALNDVAGINNQINGTHRPIYVAAVAANQTGNASLDAVHAALSNRLGHFSGVLLVIDAKGYHIGAYNTSQEVAAATNAAMDKAAKANHNDPAGAVHQLVASLAPLNWSTSGPPANSGPSTVRHHDLTWLWILGGIVGICIVGVILILITRSGANSRRARKAQRREVSDGLITVEDDIESLSNSVLLGADVSIETNAARSALLLAKKAEQSGNLDGAQSYLKVSRTQISKANRKMNPASTPRVAHNAGAVNLVPEPDRKMATIQARSPQGQTVVIKNNDYRSSRGNGYSHYYGGGMYNGTFFYPGYYSNPFWTPGWGWSPTDVLLTDMLLEDRWNGNYDRGFYDGDSSSQSDVGFDGGGESDSGTDQNFDDTSSQSDVGFDGNDNDSDNGGDGYDSSSDTGFDGSSSDYASVPDVDSGYRSSSDDGYSGSSDSGTSYSPDPTPSYSSDPSPSYDFGGSSGGSDYSGGSDSGGGGSFDF